MAKNNLATEKGASKSSVFKAPTTEKKQNVTFELVERSIDPLYPFRPLHIISSTDFIHDEKSGDERAIRYLPGSRSIYADEQNVDPAFTTAGQIEFHRGRLVVQKSQTSLLAYLRNTNQNADKKVRNTNKPPVFKELNLEQESTSKFEVMNIRRKAVEAAWYDVDNNMEAVYFYARVLGIPTSKFTEKQIINKYIEKAELNPELFLKHHKSPRNEHKYFVMTAFDKNVITSKELAGQVVWSDTKGFITVLPAGKDPIEYTTDFMINDENLTTFEALKEKVLELTK